MLACTHLKPSSSPGPDKRVLFSGIFVENMIEILLTDDASLWVSSQGVDIVDQKDWLTCFIVYIIFL